MPSECEPDSSGSRENPVQGIESMDGNEHSDSIKDGEI
jgi:hypothetical protein